MARPAGFKIRHWTDDDVEELIRMKRMGCTPAAIAEKLGRTRKAVNVKWVDVRDDRGVW